MGREVRREGKGRGGEGGLGMKRQDNGSEGESTNMNNKITPTVKHFKSTGLERHLIKTIYGKKRTEERAEEQGPRTGMQRCTLAMFLLPVHGAHSTNSITKRCINMILGTIKKEN